MLGLEEEMLKVTGRARAGKGKACCGRTSGTLGPTVTRLSAPIPAEIEDMPPFEPRVFTAGSEERVACPPPQGLPEPSVWWEHAGARLPAHGRVYQQGHELVFASTAESDAGVYTCHAANLAGWRRQDVNITVASEHLCPEGRGEEGSPGPRRSWALGVMDRGFPGAHLRPCLSSEPCRLGNQSAVGR